MLGTQPAGRTQMAVPALVLVVLTVLAVVIGIATTNAAPLPEQPVVDAGATAWMLTSTALVLLMVPGLAMFYGGLVRTKNVLGTMMHSFVAMAVVGVLWAVVGYALAFGPNALGGWIGWDEGLLFLRSIDGTVNASTHVPDLVFAMFQGKFAIITPALIAGAFAERVRFRGYIIFIALWSLLVYSPLAHWVWASDGFLFQAGAIDFAGGTVVHISAGISGLIAALYIGKRRGYPRTAMHPNNLVMVMMGVGLLWVGWFGFNAGSSLSSGVKTAQALTVTQVAAAAGALAWIAIEAVQHRKATALGIASGILAGLVVITPAAGVVTPAGAIALGFIASGLCYGAILLKGRLGYDDTLDVFGVHGVAGIAGAILLTFFIRAVDMPAGKDTMSQLLVQIASVSITIVYSAVLTIILVVFVQKVFGFKLNTQGQMSGMDHELHGETGYGLLNLNYRLLERRTMKLIVAIIQPDKLDEVHQALINAEIFRITVSRVTGHGQQEDQELYRGEEVTPSLISKVRLEIAVNEAFVEPTINAIIGAAKHGEGVIGDGKIFVLPLEQVYRIRTGERGGEAI